MNAKPQEAAPPEETGDIVLARPRGFCAGVERAIAIVERALDRFGAPIYVKHAIVHNRHVVERLERRGAIFVETLEEVPTGSRVIFSAHGVPPEAHRQAESRGLAVLDATCPLVTKVHLEARRYSNEGRTIFLIGHVGHVEVVGTRGEAPDAIQIISTVEEAERAQADNPERVAFLTQTTLSLDDTRAIVEVLRRRFPALSGPAKDDICYATQNRQNAVLALSREVDLILVVGSEKSSNSNRLVEVARTQGLPAYLVESHADVREEWLRGIRRIGITAGASAPEDVVQALAEALAKRGSATLRELEVVRENVVFALPPQLR
ncbi:MAG: 4-hydroxy-3-methylbut-2-enyl diphosphate reductase [Deltaproteobacteria bacterium]|nr:4-hydroxy-3-methylbut-2-enyl diphosphate reductase [Deltaproteobacteria bacterium]